MNEEPLPDEPDVLTIGGRQFVYLDEEEIADLQEMVEFINANRSAFYRFRYIWGRHQPPTRTQQ